MSDAYQKPTEYMRMCDRWQDSPEAHYFVAHWKAELKNTEEAAIIFVEATEAAQRSCSIDSVPLYSKYDN